MRRLAKDYFFDLFEMPEIKITAQRLLDSCMDVFDCAVSAIT